MKTEYDEMIARNADVQTIDKLLIRKTELERELSLVVKQLRALNVRWAGPQTVSAHVKLHMIKPRNKLATLRKALECGPLLEGECISNELRQFSRQWRKLIEDLRKPAEHPFHIEAEQALQSLNVSYFDGAHNARRFFAF